MKTENLAIAFVDIAGFTPRISAQTREENLRLLRRFDGAVRPLVRAYNGRVVKTIGDAFVVTFRSPTDTLLCSTAINDRLAESDAQADPAERFTIRAAVNVGEVRIDGGDVFGEAVNIAARIEGKAGAGEIYFSESTFLSIRRARCRAKKWAIPSSRASPAKSAFIACRGLTRRASRLNCMTRIAKLGIVSPLRVWDSTLFATSSP
jgi:adenylate cyclase